MDNLGDYETFIEHIDTELGNLGIRRDELLMMDHLCYRVETNERYQELKRAFQDNGAELIAENQVNGREIATFELKDPIRAGGWTVPYLELPAPKQDAPYAEGLEHAELVTVGGLDKFLQRHSELPFLHKGMNKIINPEASLKTDRISVKFHEQPLGAVARIEKRLFEKGIKYED